MKRMLIAFMLACALSGTALAGDMPGVGSAAVGPTSGGSSAPPAPGDMPGVGAATASGTNTNLVTTVLITIITTLTGQ